MCDTAAPSAEARLDIWPPTSVEEDSLGRALGRLWQVMLEEVEASSKVVAASLVNFSTFFTERLAINPCGSCLPGARW